MYGGNNIQENTMDILIGEYNYKILMLKTHQILNFMFLNTQIILTL